MSDDHAFSLNFKQIAGPGVPGTEDDIPVYHFDILDEDVPEMLGDPIGFLANRGIEKYQKMSPDETMQVTMVAASKAKVVAEGGTVSWCCYDIGEGRRCHRHGELTL
jgi:hypothetical protein